MRTAPSNPTGTAIPFCWPRLLEFILFDRSEPVTTIEAAAIPFGVGSILFGAGNAGVFAGAAPAEHGVAWGSSTIKVG